MIKVFSVDMSIVDKIVKRSCAARLTVSMTQVGNAIAFSKQALWSLQISLPPVSQDPVEVKQVVLLDQSMDAIELAVVDVKCGGSTLGLLFVWNLSIQVIPFPVTPVSS
jgi:hypothetical protein